MYHGELASFIVAFDVDTGLQERIRTMDFDPLHGDLAYDLVLSDWRPVGEIKYPFGQHYEMAGVKLMEFQVVDAVFNLSLDETLFAVTESIAHQPPRPLRPPGPTCLICGSCDAR